MTDIVADLRWRGLIHQTTDETALQKWLGEEPRTLYAGFDPTASSLHVGSLLPLLTLRRFQQAGHRPIVLVGGATGMIGDPSGKSEERNLLNVEVLRENVVAMGRQIRSFLSFEGENAAVLVNNYDWMQKFSYLEFLRDVGKHVPVNMMLTKDSVKSRIGRGSDSPEEGFTGISYTEFSYMLIQAFDFVRLHDSHRCLLQIGGSDQWGNITAGIDLGRRMRSAALFGLTTPLLTTSDGVKMGKTEKGAIWLDPNRTSPYTFYQYWRNTADNDVGRCLRFLTELSHEEIKSLDALRDSQPEKRESQVRLAEVLTELVHGATGLGAARQATKIMFGEPIENLSDAQLAEIFADVPSKTLARSVLVGEGLSLIDAFVEAGLAGTKSDARRTIKQGGAYLNNYRIADENARLTEADLATETALVLRSGKKNKAVLRFM